jgi:hypothetical protein
MKDNKPTTNKEVWQKGYISNKTRLNEINLSKCDKSKLTTYSHPTKPTKK